MSSTAPKAAGNDACNNAVFYDPDNFFDFQLPAVPRRKFLDEHAQAFDANTQTSTIALDASDALETLYPATTPLLLSRYLCIRASEKLSTELLASAELHYVLKGEGRSSNSAGNVEWSEGDVFLLPGGKVVTHAAAHDAILFTTTNEPLLAYESLQPDPAVTSRVCVAHWPASAIAERLDVVHKRARTGTESGRAVQFSTSSMAPARHPIPTMNVAMNTLEPGGDQRPHRHNGVAITLAVKGEGVYSMIEDERIDWVSGAAQITPPSELHSHHNRGSDMMCSLVIQDEGLHFYTRTPGFSWT